MPRKKIHRIKVPKTKIRKTWTRHPGEKVVGNKKRPASREVENEALDEYKDNK